MGVASRLPGSFEILPNSPGKFDADFTAWTLGGGKGRECFALTSPFSGSEYNYSDIRCLLQHITIKAAINPQDDDVFCVVNRRV